jgi:HEAT repeat protein
MWGCQSDAGSKDPLSQPPPSLDPDPPPPLVATPIDPNLQARARAELVELAKSTDANLRANTLAAMIDSMGTEAQPQFLAALDDPDPTARFVATIAAGRLKLGAARDKLLALVGGGDESVKVGAIFALHRLGDHDFSHELEATAVSPITTVRADTAVVLGYLGEPSGATILTVLLSDRELSVQEQAAQALWRLGSQQGLDVLSAKAISKYPDDQIFALDALAETGDDRVRGQVRGELGCWPPEVQLTAARAMGELRSDAGYTLGIKYATAADDLQRAMAAQALGAIGRPDSQTVLAKLLADRSPQVKLAAAAAIVQLGHHK